MIGDKEFITTVGELRKALKGIKGSDSIRIRIPYGREGFYTPYATKVQYNREWKSWFIITNEIG